MGCDCDDAVPGYQICVRHAIEKAPKRSIEARNALVEANIGLVYHVLMDKFRSWANDEDMVSAGFLGLVRAAERWDPERQTFALFACLYITGGMREHLRREQWQPRSCRGQEPIDVISFQALEDPDDWFWSSSEPDPQEAAIRAALSERVRAAVFALPREAWAPIISRFWMDIPLAAWDRARGTYRLAHALKFARHWAPALRAALEGAV